MTSTSPARRCPRPDCRGGGRVVKHSRLATHLRRQRRYRCTSCGGTFAGNAGTAYHRLRYAPGVFDRVIRMSSEGMSKAAIARVTGVSVATVTRWIERGARHAAAFGDRVVRGVDAVELQMDELKTFDGRKDRELWVYSAIEVWSRLWLTLLVGKRNLRNTRLHMVDMRERCVLNGDCVLITSDEYKFNERVVRKAFGSPRFAYVQVKKRCRSNTVVRLDWRQVTGSLGALERAVERSEDSKRMNTAYVERLNLTIRRSIAALQRKSTSFCRSESRLRDQLEILRCYYNFIRPHSSLRFGREYRTPAMQAGLVKRPLRFRDIFKCVLHKLREGGRMEQQRGWPRGLRPALGSL